MHGRFVLQSKLHTLKHFYPINY